MLRRILSVASLLTLAVVASCGGDGSPFAPLPGGIALPVTLTTATDQSSSGERLDVVAVPGGAELTWDLVSSPCLDATATALQSGNVVEVRVHRSANPLAQCVAMQVSYRYVARVQMPAPGQYDVRLVDDMLGQPLRPVGRGSVAVPPRD
jgi:hypothetical protein